MTARVGDDSGAFPQSVLRALRRSPLRRISMRMVRGVMAARPREESR
jgi:hypothetical protein